ncbi:MAG: hypothetical protein V2G47_07470 [bacterium JZ-2024 1]
MKSFPPDIYKFLELRYGLRTGKPLSLRKTGKRWKGISRQRAHQILSRTLHQLKQVEATFLPLFDKGVAEILQKYGGLITLSNFQKEWCAYAPSPAFGAGILWLLNEYFHHKGEFLLEKVENGFYTGTGKEYQTIRSDGRRAIQFLFQILEEKGALTQKELWQSLSQKMPRKSVKARFSPLFQQMLQENYLRHTPTGYIVLSRKSRTLSGKVFIALAYLGSPSTVPQIRDTLIQLFGPSPEFTPQRLYSVLNRKSAPFIWTGKRSEYALSHWGIPVAKKPRTPSRVKIEVIQQALAKLGKPSHPEEILQCIQQEIAPHQPFTFHSIYHTLLRHKEKFIRVYPKGKFALREWNFPEYYPPKVILKEILIEAKKPLSLQEILSKIRQKNPNIPEKTLFSYLYRDPDFLLTSERTWVLNSPEVYRDTPFFGKISQWKEEYAEKKKKRLFQRYLRQLLQGPVSRHLPISLIRWGLKNLEEKEEYALIVKIAPRLPHHPHLKGFINRAKKHLLF